MSNHPFLYDAVAQLARAWGSRPCMSPVQVRPASLYARIWDAGRHNVILRGGEKLSPRTDAGCATSGGIVTRPARQGHEPYFDSPEKDGQGSYVSMAARKDGQNNWQPERRHGERSSNQQLAAGKTAGARGRRPGMPGWAPEKRPCNEY